MKSPEVSVVMPVYNCAAYVAQAIDSILQQSYREIEFVIINDGSTDGSGEIIDSYAATDSRIRVIHQDNQGLISSLNTGCRLAKGNIIARMDADDVSLPERLAQQMALMHSHQDLGVVSTWMVNIDERGKRIGAWRTPVNDGAIKWRMHFQSPIVHAAACLRRELLERVGFYSHDAGHVEDYDLWLKLSSVTRFASIPQYYYIRRVRREGVCAMHRSGQQAQVANLARAHIERTLSVSIPLEAITDMGMLYGGAVITEIDRIVNVEKALASLASHYLMSARLGKEEVREVRYDVAVRLFSLAKMAAPSSPLISYQLVRRALSFEPRAPVMRLLRKVRGL